MNTKLLRQKILDLAIRGNLTEQKKSDGTTRDLLVSIAASSACHSERSAKGAKSSRVILSKRSASKDLAKEIIPLDKSEAPFEIPENWEWVRLGDLMCKIGSGSTPTGGKKIYGHTGIMFIRSQNVYNDGLILDDVAFIDSAIHEKMQGSKVVASDLLLNITGASIGRCSIVPKDFETANINQHVLILRLICKAMLGYVHTAITSKFVFGQIMASQVGGTKEGLSAERAKSLLIPLPPLAEQQRIVTAIENAFAEITEIENNQELLKKHIKQGRQKILDLAIHGKLTQHLKTDGTTKDLLKQISSNVILSNAKNPAETVKSSRVILSKRSASKDLAKEIIPLDKTTAPFEIPSTWEWVKINDIALDMADGPFGSNLKAEHYTDKKEARIIQLSNIAENGWRDENVRYTTFEHAKNNVFRSVVEPGNLVVAKMMPAGRTMICPSTEKMYVLSSDAVKLVPNDNLVDRQFLCLVMNSPSFRAQINDNIQGTTRLRTSISKLRDCMLALPPLAEQQRIVATIEQAFAELDSME